MRKESLAEELGNVKAMVSGHGCIIHANGLRYKAWRMMTEPLEQIRIETQFICENKDWFNINLKRQEQWRGYLKSIMK